MKWVDMNLFHRGQYEYNYSHIGMGCHNSSVLAGLYPVHIHCFHQLDNRLDTVLTSINVGGEQSRQFAHEIKIIDELLRDLG